MTAAAKSLTPACRTPKRRSSRWPSACAARSPSTPRSSASIPAAHGSRSGLPALVPGNHPVGFIDVSFYRDDYSRTGLKSGAKRTDLPFDVDGATIVLVDDVLYTGRSVRAAINELFDFGRPGAHRARRADRPRRTRVADRADLLRRAARGGARPVDRPVARLATACGSRSKGSRADALMRNPQLNANGELTHLLTLEGLPRRRHPQHPRYRRSVRVDRRARGEEGPAAARQGGVQPVLRELDAHAHDVRDRGQAAVRRRHQSQHRRLVDEQGRDAARHRRQPGGDGRRHLRRAPCAVRRAAPHRAASERARAQSCPRRQRRRRPPRASRRRDCSTCTRSATTRRHSTS